MDCDIAEVVQMATENLDALLNDVHLHQWPQVVQSMNHLDETTEALCIALDEIIELVKELSNVEAELSFNLDDLKNSIYVPREVLEKHGLPFDLPEKGELKGDGEQPAGN